MKKLMLLCLILIPILLISCDNNELEESFITYRNTQTEGIRINFKVLDLQIIDTITNQDKVKDSWNEMVLISEQLTAELLSDFLIQENDLKRMKDYYSFAQKHKGESKFVDEYLNIMTKGLLIQENGINESRIAQRVEVFLWFTNRKNHFWGRSKIKSIPINEMENIEIIMTNPETPEYFRVNVHYQFKNPILNNAVIELNEIYHYNLNGECICEE